MVARNVSLAWAGLLLCFHSAYADTKSALAFKLDVSITHQYATDDDTTIGFAALLEPELEYALSENVSLHLSGRVVLDQQDSLLPGQPEFENYNDGTAPYSFNDAVVGELRDAYLDITTSQGQIRLGKQQIVWGALDGIKVLDVLNPQSFEEFIVDDFEDSRIGLWSAYADLTLADWRVELAYIPDTTTHYLPEPGAFFEFTAPRFRFGSSASASTLPVRHLGPTQDEGALGLRVSRYLGGIDLQFVAINGVDFAVDAGEPLLELFNERRELYGLALEGSWSRFVLRGEFSYSPNRVFNRRILDELETIELEQWRGALGLDIAAPWGVFVNVQYLQDQLVDAPPDVVRPEEDEIVTVFLRKRFAYDTFGVDLRWYSSLEEGDELLSLQFNYQFSDRGEIEVAVDQFHGDDIGPFGQFRNRDRVTLSLKYTL